MKIKILCIFFLSLSVSLFAIDGKIKVFIKSNEAVYTSQKTTISVELLSTAYSITNTKISFPSSSNYIVQAPQSASYLGKVEIDNNDWQMVHYEYEVYALKAGQINIPSFDIFFTASMGYGQPVKEFELKSEALNFDVKSPEGLKTKQFVLVTDNYALDTELKPEKKRLIIGDAVTLTVTQKAQGVPDILLRPIRYNSNALVRVYEKEPKLQSGLKGKYDVSRTDSFTFVASAEGNVSLPSQEILWWNSKTRKLHKETLEAIEFEIIPDPQIALDAQNEIKKKCLLLAVAFVLFLALLYWLFAKRIKAVIAQGKEVFKTSEAGHFKVLLETLERRDLAQAYTLFYAWLLTLNPELAEEGFNGIGEEYPSFDTSLQTFEHVLTHENETFYTEEFIVALKEFRKNVLHVKKSENAKLLGTLNP
ncbi:MAG: hypothetical protein GQ531_07285 [Sulfurovum sp.]|nr:hypothetical protein [Sulfurovum sp.]